MKSTKSKLLHEFAGKSMLSFAVSSAAALNPDHLVVVVGHLREQVEAHLDKLSETVVTAVQEEQLGTGHAVSCGLEGLEHLTGDVVVTYANVPIHTGDTLRQLVAVHRANQHAATVLTARVADPAGYGRVLRDGDAVVGIVEHRDATEEQRRIDEINSGIYVFDAGLLAEGLAGLQAKNAQGELYLTDVIAHAVGAGRRVGAQVLDDYLHALDQILPRLTQANLPLACQIAELPKTIKGYGPIRQPHAAAARQQWQQWLAQGFSAPPGP